MRACAPHFGFFFLAFAASAEPSALASVACGVLDDSLKYEIDEFTSYRTQNQLMLQNLLGTETGCKDDGAALSLKVAQVSQGLSCQSAIDASKMNEQLAGLGKRCESHFAEIHSLQDQLRARFETVQKDLEAGMESLKRSRRIQAKCGDEVKAARKMVDTFLDLQRGILDVESRSVDGQTNYGKFKQTAADLRGLTASQGENCGVGTGAVLEALKSAGSGSPPPGSGSGVPAGKSADPASTITGNVDDKSLVAGSTSPATGKQAHAVPNLISTGSGPAKVAAATPGRSGASQVTASFSGDLPMTAGLLQPKDGAAAPRGLASVRAEESAGGVLWQESADATGFHLSVGGGAGSAVSVSSGLGAEGLAGLNGAVNSPAPGGGGVAPEALAGADGPDETIFNRVKRCYQRTALFSAAVRGPWLGR